jgi:hypothetical protein
MADLSGYATTQDLNVETNRAIATESFIQTNLDAETNRATAAESNIQTSLDAEISRATAAEQALDNKIYFKDAPLPGSIYSSNPGNVGIGTDMPSAKLDVDGNVLVRQNLNVDGNSMTTGNSYVGGTSRANGFVKSGGQSYEYLMADGTTSYGPSLSGLVTMADLSGYATTQDLNVETNRAIATESFIQTNLDAETMRATDAENNIETSLIVETNRAIAAEQALASATKRGTVGYFGNVSIGTGFTVSVPTIGYYSIFFDTPLTNTPIVVATLVDEIGFCAISNVSTTGFTVKIKSPNNNAMNSSFSFIVMAP